MSSALFWPAFLYAAGGSASAPTAFDIDTLEDPHRWLVLDPPDAAVELSLAERRLVAVAFA